MAKNKINQEALDYHSQGRPGKIEVVPTKPYSSQRDLSLAYSPGVAEPCLQIADNKEDVYKYTAKGNLVAVISNGTAVLGLADIDVFDIEIDQTNVDDFVKTVKAISPTFGGINLEDIKAPECFEIERRLKAKMRIPVFHDDQHGTAVVVAAAFINGLHLVRKRIESVKLVVSGAGAAAIACAELLIRLGLPRANVWLTDTAGLVHEG